MSAAHEYTASTHWQRRSDEPFTDNRYHRGHTMQFDGGITLPASSSPLSVRLPYSDPNAVDPEEAFVAALSSCHLLTFLFLAGKAGWVVDDYRDDAVGLMTSIGSGRMAITQVRLRPAVRFGGGRTPTAEQLDALHHAAHEQCYIANSVKTEVLCEPVVPAAQEG